MKQPPGYKNGTNEKTVWKLNKGLYGLKQSARCWYQVLNDHLIESGYTQTSDPCLYIKTEGKNFVLICVHVDDSLIAASDLDMLHREKSSFVDKFEMHDIGEAAYILRMKISRDLENRILTLSQESYVKNIIERFRMKECKPVTTPMETGLKLEKNENAPVKLKEYQALIGSLTYAAMAKRPDISSALNIVSQFASCPGNEHWTAAKRILRYLQGTSDWGITFNASNSTLDLLGYVDADWAGDPVTRKSQSGYVFMLGGGAVSWASKKQSVVALSTTEAEYVSASLAAQEAIWLRRLLSELGFPQSCTTLYEDNMSCIDVSKNPKFHARMKHIDIKHHFLRDCAENALIASKYCRTECQLADVFTKALPREKFMCMIGKIGLKSNK